MSVGLYMIVKDEVKSVKQLVSNTENAGGLVRYVDEVFLTVSDKRLTTSFQSGIKTLLCILTIVLRLIDLTKLEITITNKETLTTLFG